MKKTLRIICLLLAVFAGLAVTEPAEAALQDKNVTIQADSKCKSLGRAAWEAAGKADLKKMTEDAFYFGALTTSDRSKVKQIWYATDNEAVYSVAVIEAGNVKKAKALLKTLKNYKKQNCNNPYFGDYTADQQSVLKNAVCGRKGKYIWYIALSTSADINKKGQTAIKGGL